MSPSQAHRVRGSPSLVGSVSIPLDSSPLSFVVAIGFHFPEKASVGVSAPARFIHPLNVAPEDTGFSLTIST